MDDDLGTVVADERIYRITRISLEDGSICFHTVRFPGRDEPASQIREYVVFGADGQLVTRSDRHANPLPIPPVGASDTVHVTVRLDVTRKETVQGHWEHTSS